MTGTKTLAILKPSAVKKRYIGFILEKITAAGFHISAMKLTQLTRSQAERFYAVHKGKPFYPPLIEKMISGQIVVAILEKKDAVNEFRKLIGDTDPSKAAKDTIRQLYGESVRRNAIHGSDNDSNAEIECNFFFSQSERFSIFE